MSCNLDRLLNTIIWNWDYFKILFWNYSWINSPFISPRVNLKSSSLFWSFKIKMFLHIVRWKCRIEMCERISEENLSQFWHQRFFCDYMVLKMVREFKIWLHIQMQRICYIHTTGEYKIPGYRDIRDDIAWESIRWTKNYVTHICYVIIFKYYSTSSLTVIYFGIFAACSD
jgi:hypothetical protein